jgi:hypothetical protein
MCDCQAHDPAFSRWTGFWPGEVEAKALGIDLNEFLERGLHRIFFIKPGPQSGPHTNFKFRAECFTDLISLFKVMVVMHPECTIQTVSIKKIDNLPDVEVEMEVLGGDLEKLRACMERAPGGHVMSETLDYADRYTGRRLGRLKLCR